VLRPPAPPQSHAPGLDSTAGVGARAALAAGIRGRDASRLIAGACALLGLGEGLTPAGDDCLVGALAVLHAVDPAPLMREPAVAGAIAEAAAARTTAIGREFVLHALAGRFSEPVLAVLRARSRAESARAAAHLAALGATSGADTLGGMRLAWDALPPEPWRRPLSSSAAPTHPTRILGLCDHGLHVGARADLAVWETDRPEGILAALAPCRSL
jgi:hypothetical protein